MNEITLDRRNVGAILSLLMLLNLILVLLFQNYFLVVSVFGLGILRLIYDRFEFLRPSSGFLLPWIVIFIFLNLDITIYSRAVNITTLRLMCIPISFCVIFGSEFFDLSNKLTAVPKLSINGFWYNIFLYIGLGLFAINVIASGFLPLIRSILTGQSDYFDYGIKGLNGMFYAYSNAFGLLAYSLFLDTGKKKYLFHVGLVVLIFLLCLTRQNIISVVTEIFILHSFKRGVIPKKKLLIYVGLMLLAFGALGELRSGDIKEIMGLRKEFYWLPTAFIWIYSYGFFNILNLDNLVASKSFALFDLSSVSTLLPSFLRPIPIEEESVLEVINFNISSYINPIFKDLGFNGVMVFTAIIVYVTMISYKAAMNYGSFKSISIYCVLLFCALFSFFINFWFYLPIMFQIPFLIMFNHFVIKHEE